MTDENSEPWTPFGADPDRHAALVGGIPVWMRRPLSDWLRELVDVRYGQPAHLLRIFDQRVRLPGILLSGVQEDFGFDSLESQLFDHPDDYLALLDFLIFSLNTAGRHATLDELQSILRISSSEWKVGKRGSHAGIEKRVPEGVQHAADEVMAVPGHAGQLLSEAWHAAFGRDPDFEKAYAKSIKAVEAAAIPSVSPKNVNATLGTVIAQMRDQKDWKLELTREHSTHTSAQVLLGMMQMLWTGQNDRHAGQTGYQPSTQSEAETAVLLAVPLVQWFTSGALQRRP